MLNTSITEPKKLISALGINTPIACDLPKRRDEAILFCPVANLPATSVAFAGLPQAGRQF